MSCINITNLTSESVGHVVTSVFACYLDTIMYYGQRLQDYLNIQLSGLIDKNTQKGIVNGVEKH